MSIRILVVDDQPMYRVGVAAILGAQPDFEIVGEAGDGVEAIGRNRVVHPDVVLMDVRMPTMDGIEATRQLTRPAGPANVPRVIILTTFDIDDYVYDALRAGASGRSDVEIAKELFIAEQTAKTHVSKVLSKLDLRDRVQAVVLGYETGFVKPGNDRTD